MINAEGFYQMPKPSPDSMGAGGQELSRLLGAALINRSFCHLLLNNPQNALETGFHGYRFRLSPEEVQILLSIQADSLADLAAQLVSAQSYSPMGPAIEPAKDQFPIHGSSWVVLSEIQGTD